ncbi:MAG: hypothetical protein PUB21_00535 [Bacteroidales bacterium]|nr:hypothetical protein [Bacteroidales bacterium]
MRKKLLSFFICYIAILLYSSCTNDLLNPIPNVPVVLDIDLTFKDKDLVPVYAVKSYTTPKTATEKLGFGGVVVIHGLDNGSGQEYYAYDLACPNESTPDIRVAPDSIGHAKCTNCKSEYDLSIGLGNRISGPSKSDLKRYNARQVGNIVYIRNY